MADTPVDRHHLLHWEDLRLDAESAVGPEIITEDQVDRYCELLGARSTDRRIVSEPLLHSIAAGRVGKRKGFLDIIGVRRGSYRHIRALRVGESFTIRSRIVATEPVDAERGMIDILRHIVSAGGEVVSEARLNVLVRRRPSRS